MKVDYKDYTIEIADDFKYTLNSSDAYTFQYYEATEQEHKNFPGAKHGIRIFKDGHEMVSAFLSKPGSYTHIHEHSFVIVNDTLFICCSDEIYSLQLPTLLLHWHKKVDLAVCIAIYPFKNDFIVHGELFVTRIDKEGNKLWEFNAYDVFVPQDDKPAIEIMKDVLILRDYEGYEYKLNENGEVLEKSKS